MHGPLISEILAKVRRSTRLITLRGSTSIGRKCLSNSLTPTSRSASSRGCPSSGSTLSASNIARSIPINNDSIDNHQSTFDRAFHTSSKPFAQVLPDDKSWNYHQSSPPPPPSKPSTIDTLPDNFPSSSFYPSNNSQRSSSWPSRKGKEKALPPKPRSIQDESDLEQSSFKITSENIDEVFQSSLEADDDTPFDGLTEEEIIGLVESMGESHLDLESESLPEQDPAPQLPSEAIDPFAPPKAVQAYNEKMLIDQTTKDKLPPLPIPNFPPDDKTRFDWRTRALSQKKKFSYFNWFGNNLPHRKEAPWTKLQYGENYREELDRYTKHFQPLLEAEQAEEERIFNERIAEWSFERLKREGYTLDEMRGSIKYQPKSLVGLYTVYNFIRGKGDRELPFNRFTVGTNVVISRIDPKVDPVGGIINGKHKLIGSVWNSTKGNLRIMFSENIEDIESGNWRLDVAPNDFAFQRQIEALKALNLDIFQQDMGDFPNKISAQPIKEAAQSTSTQKQKRKYQTILRGTSLRDHLLRAFQEDYTVPEKSHSSINANLPQHVTDHIVQDPNQMLPSDLDAIPLVTPQRKIATSILAKNQLIQSWTERYRHAGKPLKIEGDPDVGLNESQMRAIAMMLSERSSLVQGPPGTGKTRVIIETIKLLKKHWQIPYPILVTAHTNVAVDNLLSGLRKQDLKALRFGAMNRIPEEFGDWTLDRMIGKHPNWFQLEQARKEKDLLLEKKLKFGPTAEGEARLGKLNQKIWAIRQDIMRDVLLDADVVCTTCLSATSKALQGIDFPIVFLDEASMATEPLSLVPLTKGSSHVAIIGDHKQLPPVIVSPEAHAGGLATSLFERLIHEGNIPSIMLDTQYRMHPSLASFPSKTFYSGLLKDGTPPADRLAPETEFLLKDEQGNRKNITFLNHDHPESPMAKSIANYGDAEYVCDVIADLMYKNPDLKASQIGIITPYLSQLRLLSNHLSDSNRRSAFIDLLGNERTKELDDIEIKTVDGFEGREKQVIIFSCVRCNDGGWIGFLSDWRRVNVALTRAKKALIMIGSKKTLQKARVGKNAEELLPSGGTKVWRELIGWLEKENNIMDI
ncbi:uncharacterized protein L201_004024 [Kwoniella dendrophila CBS 6074]|uniref:DNA helicase n=1 Tax=Kwoniella dendrophila CBS 6074 TaxID=1295534 RepID=A0AAX4JV52_9TREE